MSRKSLLRLGALAVLWGSGFLFVKVALGGLSPFQVVFGRLLAGSLAMLGLTVASKQALPRKRRTWVHLGIMAVITNIAPYFLFAWADFLFALTLTTTEDVRPVTLGLYQYIGTYVNDWASVMATAAHAERRIALVIGNSGYKAVSPLANPKHERTRSFLAKVL